MAKRFRPLLVDRRRLMVVSAFADEAGAALNFSQFAAWVIARVLKHLRMRNVAIAVVVFVVIASVTQAVFDSGSADPHAAELAVTWTILSVVIALGLFGAMLPTLVLLSNLPFGLDVVVWGLRAQPRAAASPLAQATVMQLGPPQPPEATDDESLAVAAGTSEIEIP
jgi:hypothetical protein